MASEDWVAEKLMLVATNPRESFVGMDDIVVDDRSLSSFGKTIKSIENHDSFVKLPMEYEEVDDDKLSLRWSMQRQRKTKRKEKVEEPLKVTKTYTTRSVEKKFMKDAMKENMSATTKRRRLRK